MQLTNDKDTETLVEIGKIVDFTNYAIRFRMASVDK